MVISDFGSFPVSLIVCLSSFSRVFPFVTFETTLSRWFLLFKMNNEYLRLDGQAKKNTSTSSKLDIKAFSEIFIYSGKTSEKVWNKETKLGWRRETMYGSNNIDLEGDWKRDCRKKRERQKYLVR